MPVAVWLQSRAEVVVELARGRRSGREEEVKIVFAFEREERCKNNRVV